MKKLFSVFTAFIIFATIFTSCEKQSFENPEQQEKNTTAETDNLSDIKVENGILSFKDYDHFCNSVHILNKMDEKEYLVWISEKGVNTLYEKVIESTNSEMVEADNLKKGETTEITRENIENNYLIREEDKDGTLILKPACGIEPISCVLNLKKVVIIGNNIEYYDENSLKIIQSKNFDLIDKLASTNTSTSEINVIDYNSKTDRIDWFYLHNYYGGNNNKYKIYFTISFRQIKINSTQYRTWYWTSQSSYKKNIFGNYKAHTTTFRIDHDWKIRWTPLNSYQRTQGWGMAGGKTSDTYYWMFTDQTNTWANFTHTHEIYYGKTTMNTDDVDFNYSHGATGRLK